MNEEFIKKFMIYKSDTMKSDDFILERDYAEYIEFLEETILSNLIG